MTITLAQNSLLANLALGLALGGPVCACDRRSAFHCPVHATKMEECVCAEINTCHCPVHGQDNDPELEPAEVSYDADNETKHLGDEHPENDEDPRDDDGAAWPQDRGPGMMSREEEDCRGYSLPEFQRWIR